MRWHLIFALSILSITLLGCLSKPVSSSRVAEGIVVEIWASNSCTQPGDVIKLRATVTNNGATPHIVELKDQPVFDITVGDQGSVVHWSDGKPLTSDLTRLELKPGEFKKIEMDWVVTRPASGSVFTVQARFIYSPRAVSDPLQPGILINVSVCPGPFGP